MSADGSGELVAEAVEVHLEAGDALLFVDCMLHGSARRINPGDRRIFIARCKFVYVFVLLGQLLHTVTTSDVAAILTATFVHLPALLSPFLSPRAINLCVRVCLIVPLSGGVLS